MFRSPRAALVVLTALLGTSALAAGDQPAERGRKALLAKNFNPPTMALSNYDNAWKHWGLDARPDANDYDRLFRERYGLHPAPYPNHQLPMGLKQADGGLALGFRKGLTTDCLICHGGSILGQSYVGLGNSTLDFHAFY